MKDGISIDFVQPIFSISDNARNFGEIFLGFFGLLAIVYLVSVAKRRREIWPLMLIVATPFILCQEALSDILGRCAYAAGDNQHVALTILGRELPLYIFLGYFAYFAPVAWLVETFEKGITKLQFYKIYVGFIVGCLGFEALPIYMKWWIYYGDNQPLNFGGWVAPMWWWFADATCLLGMGVAFFYAYKHWFTRPWHNLLYIPLGLLSIAAGIHPPAIPLWVTISADASLTVTTIATFISIAMSIAMAWVMARMVTIPESAIAGVNAHRMPLAA